MSILGDVVGSLFGGIFDNLFTGGRTDKKLARLAEEGELVPARIYAIRVVVKSDSADEWTYGIDLVTRNGPLRASVRQQLRPESWRAPLGGRALARHLNGRVAIDWPATLAEAGVETDHSLMAGKTLKKPLEPGVEDGNVNAKRLRNGTRTEAEVVAVEDVSVMGMPTENRRMELRLDDPAVGGPRTVVSKREYVPPYVRSLAVVGARVPVAVDQKKPDRVTVDWPAFAEAAAPVAARAL
ncbi:MAG TPA: DUF3592 domain-containing protein [Conexibacter sp.]|jgi:hypothetical protein|nr:DUF3592 domain-containing protein [Conexibacter sp.]